MAPSARLQAKSSFNRVSNPNVTIPTLHLPIGQRPFSIHTGCRLVSTGRRSRHTHHPQCSSTCQLTEVMQALAAKTLVQYAHTYKVKTENLV